MLLMDESLGFKWFYQVLISIIQVCCWNSYIKSAQHLSIQPALQRMGGGFKNNYPLVL